MYVWREWKIKDVIANDDKYYVEHSCFIYAVANMFHEKLW